MYSSYTAASFARKHDLADRHGVNLEGALTWAFEFEDRALFRRLPRAGKQRHRLARDERLSHVQPDDRPAARRASSSEVPLDEMLKSGVRTTPDVAAMAAIDDTTLTILAWHYHDDDVAGPDAAITIDLSGLPPAGQPTLHHFRIDREHSNAFEAWKKIGSPAEPSPEQYKSLERASQLAEIEGPKAVQIQDGKVSLKLTLPRQAVSLLRIDLRSEAAAKGK